MKTALSKNNIIYGLQQEEPYLIMSLYVTVLDYSTAIVWMKLEKSESQKNPPDLWMPGFIQQAWI